MSDLSTMDLLREALALHRGGSVSEAAARYAAILRVDPANADATYYLAMIACQNGRFEEGAALARRVLSHDPRHVQAHILLGRALSALGRHEEALASLDEAIALAPQLAEPHSHRAEVLTDLARNSEALDSYDRALLLKPDAVEDWCNRGLVLVALGRRAEAVASFDRAIAARPDFARAHAWRADALSQLGRSQEALDGADRALALEPELAEGWFCQANVLFKMNRHVEALAAYDNALSLKPELSEAWIGRADILRELGRHEEALKSYESSLAANPDSAAAWLGRGTVLSELRRHDEAIAAHERALALKPDLAEAWLGRGNAFSELQRYDDASAAYDWALASKPDLAAAWLGRGNIFLQQKAYDEALAAYRQAVALDARLAAAWLGEGNVLFELKQHDGAVVAYDKALTLKHDLAEAWLGRGNVSFELKQYRDALAAYDKALGLKSDLSQAWLGRGNVFVQLKRYDDALAAYQRASAISPHYGEPWLGQANVFLELRRYGDAATAADRAVTIDPDLPYAAGMRLHSNLHICDWTNFETQATQLLSGLRNKHSLVFPFVLLGLPSSAADQLECAKRYMDSQPKFQPLWQGETYRHDRIRVAYLSADFHDHPVAHLAVGLFEQHDRARFQVMGMSFGPDDGSAMRDRVKKAVEHFVDVADKSDEDIASFLRQHEIDIAVDLMGFTQNNRCNVLARRPAPIQVNYLGYAGTMGARFIDYILADQTAIPSDQRKFYSEEVIWLPDSCLISDNRQPIGETPTRSQCGLPETGFVFSCFNNISKITPEVFQVWMRLLKAAPDSVLWLKVTEPVAEQNLRREAQQSGVPAERLIFAPRVPTLADHLARLRHADLFLDTLPYNAHATAIDALWAGLPLLTCIGTTFASRVAASLLQAIGLDELITQSLAEYEAVALKYATEPSLLAPIKEKLARNRASYPLFDTQRVTRNIESAFTAMVERLNKKPQGGFRAND